MNLTLEEQERMAFNSGNMELAVYLGRLIDALGEVETLEQRNETLEQRNEELREEKDDLLYQIEELKDTQ